ncbi:RNA/RNP complex-1-interacting phosphatase isoform X4 [Sapajus apella]|uniref:RNA/RNP complex-1-interacting phosphatase isoform X4 n=1 Tax=Sapajus apella TaxID=9515 RepID=A0A6J3HCH9_SAPAP|nr:RNA/RNP complex-1-interacting phosphatase isoform X4 [Sapajus apella]
MRNSETPELCVGGFRVCLGLESYPGTEGAGLALLAGLALRGRLLGAHMSQWHHPGSGWGRGRDFPGHSPAKKSGNHVPERQTFWCPLFPWVKQDWLPHLQNVFTESKCLLERPYGSSWSPWRSLFTQEVHLECEAKCQ